MTIPEVIAMLDAHERDLQGMIQVTRQMRHLLFETLDNDPDALVD